MHIPLHPDIEKYIGEQVHAGEYRSPDEVVTDALFLLWQQQEDQAGDAGSAPGMANMV
jgi:Arc/MetJ-type ribon-helix-helix transcriptional regulator